MLKTPLVVQYGASLVSTQWLSWDVGTHKAERAKQIYDESTGNAEQACKDEYEDFRVCVTHYVAAHRALSAQREAQQRDQPG